MGMLIGIFNGTDVETVTNALHAAGISDDKIQILNDAPSNNTDVSEPTTLGDNIALPVVPINLGGGSTGMSPLAGGFGVLPESGDQNLSLSGLHLPAEARSFYQESLKNGATVIAVTADADQLPRVRTIFQQANAANIAEPDAS